jgi:carotenoid cleavage dioxygenase-like enzyme
MSLQGQFQRHEKLFSQLKAAQLYQDDALPKLSLNTADMTLVFAVLANLLIIYRVSVTFRTLKDSRDVPTVTAQRHPYLSGNFAPIETEVPLTPCLVYGSLPTELTGGQYIRNGGNPLFGKSIAQNPDAQFHWFDGDGMLSGVYFPQGEHGLVVPHFVNAYVLTDVYLHAKATPALRKPFIPSIALFSDPLARLTSVIGAIMRSVALVVASNLPGAKQVLRKLSVANTAVIYHDGRALATCESGPPMRVQLPALETVGWFDGARAEGEGATSVSQDSSMQAFGEGDLFLGWMKAWTTAHPRVDPYTNELILYHSMILPPYIHYSVLPAADSPVTSHRLVSVPVPGLPAPKLSHDFACTLTHTILLDLPLHLNPLHGASLNPQPMVLYDPAGYARFGVFPRYDPGSVRWIEDREGGACCVFHTAVSWDELASSGEHMGVSILGCRLNSAALVYSAGNLPAPSHALPPAGVPEACELFYWRLSNLSNTPMEAFSLSAIPFEFPAVPRASGMGWPAALGGGSPRYVWGCTLRNGSFGAGLGRTAKVDALAKLDVSTLIRHGQIRQVGDRSAVDKRTVEEIISMQHQHENENDPIKIFVLPPGWAAQEPTFVPRANPKGEDDGFLLTYVFDEAQLDASGEAGPTTRSELWIIDAANMTNIIARIVLPQRVPYGLHGDWFTEENVRKQRPVETIRRVHGV